MGIIKSLNQIKISWSTIKKKLKNRSS